MATDPPPASEEVERYARQTGLINLTSDQMEELRQAAAYARDLLARLPRDFTLTDEPAHIFRASDDA